MPAMPTRLSSDTSARYSFDGWADPKYTLERREAADLIQLVASNKRTYIDGRRRCGKTTLVVNTLAAANVPVLRIDLEGVESIEKLTERVSAAANSFIQEYPRAREKLVASTKTKAGISGSLLGVLRLNLEGEKSVPPPPVERTLDGLLAAITEVARVTGAAVFVDEFQAVKSPKMKNPAEVLGSFAAASDPEVTRGEVAFIFAGSDRHAMHQIFAGPESLFFQRTTNLPVGPIPEEEMIPFLNKRFGAEVPPAIGQEAFRWTEGIPGDLQRLYSSMRRVSPGKAVVTPEVLNHAKSLVTEELGRGYALTLQTLKPNVLKMLDLIVREDVRSTDQLGKMIRSAGWTVTAANEALADLLRVGLIHVRGTTRVIERPEPIIFHYLAVHPAVSHRPYTQILEETEADLKKLSVSLPEVAATPDVR